MALSRLIFQTYDSVQSANVHGSCGDKCDNLYKVHVMVGKFWGVAVLGEVRLSVTATAVVTIRRGNRAVMSDLNWHPRKAET